MLRKTSLLVALIGCLLGDGASAAAFRYGGLDIIALDSPCRPKEGSPVSGMAGQVLVSHVGEMGGMEPIFRQTGLINDAARNNELDLAAIDRPAVWVGFCFPGRKLNEGEFDFILRQNDVGVRVHHAPLDGPLDERGYIFAVRPMGMRPERLSVIHRHERRTVSDILSCEMDVQIDFTGSVELNGASFDNLKRHPWSMLRHQVVSRDFIRAPGFFEGGIRSSGGLSGFNGHITSGYGGVLGVFQRPENKQKSDDGEDGLGPSCPSGYFRPFDLLPLGSQIAGLALLFFLGCALIVLCFQRGGTALNSALNGFKYQWGVVCFWLVVGFFGATLGGGVITYGLGEYAAPYRYERAY